MTDREAYIALNALEKLGPVRTRALIDALGSPQAILSAGLDALCRARGVGRSLAESIVAARDRLDPADEIKKAAAMDLRILTPADDEYPGPLRTLHDPPLALYVAGTLVPEDRHALAVVGSRRCSHYGVSVADRFAYQLAKAGFTVVSGLARGIDTAAHEGALKANGRTVAVLGSAMDQLYPAEARPLARRIAASGAVISEYPLGRMPDRTTFPYRNRIISGLSLGVVVVEADRKSGAMITAAQALDQGRSVFAVPGRIDQPMANGPHSLLKGGARLATDVADIFEEFQYLRPAVLGAPGTEPASQGGDAGPALHFSETERALLACLLEGAVDVDTLANRTGLSSRDLSGMLLGLELRRAIRMLPGRMVELAVGAGAGPESGGTAAEHNAFQTIGFQ